jgi:hypothetical protein
VKQQNSSTATSILTTKSKYGNLSAQRLSERTVQISPKYVVGIASIEQNSLYCIQGSHFERIPLKKESKMYFADFLYKHVPEINAKAV